jgi:hypothetical protein
MRSSDEGFIVVLKIYLVEWAVVMIGVLMVKKGLGAGVFLYVCGTQGGLGDFAGGLIETVPDGRSTLHRCGDGTCERHEETSRTVRKAADTKFLDDDAALICGCGILNGSMSG